MKLKTYDEVIQYIKDAGFEIDDEAAEIIWSWITENFISKDIIEKTLNDTIIENMNEDTSVAYRQYGQFGMHAVNEILKDIKDKLDL